MHVVHLRGRTSQLQLGLSQSNALRLTEHIRVRNRQNIHAVIKIRLLDRGFRALNGIRVLRRQAFGHHTRQNLKFKPHSIMKALVDGTHHPRALLQQRNSRSDSRLLVAVANFHVCNRRKPPTSVYYEPKKVK